MTDTLVVEAATSSDTSETKALADCFRLMTGAAAAVRVLVSVSQGDATRDAPIAAKTVEAFLAHVGGNAARRHAALEAMRSVAADQIDRVHGGIWALQPLDRRLAALALEMAGVDP